MENSRIREIQNTKKVSLTPESEYYRRYDIIHSVDIFFACAEGRFFCSIPGRTYNLNWVNWQEDLPKVNGIPYDVPGQFVVPVSKPVQESLF